MGTALPAGVFALSGFSGGAFDTGLIIGLAAAIIGPILMVGWPVAYWGTRKLDNLTEFHATAFE
ncbi:hypothetical protein [Altererythrobacter sp. ZODW24]|uniref:hypothetical protein n=1 Tax=Altererythrobacter sp. ZODW24 TaxID=2185142 RepID=UPI0013B470C0|nr:hypothetical protein [Altererythrobacter sp. ZODW24]